jgi:hypothetical protein
MKSDMDYSRFDDNQKREADTDSYSGGSMKVIAFVAVVFSTVAVAASFLTIPLVFEHMQRLQARVRHEVDICQVGVHMDTFMQLLSLDIDRHDEFVA